MKLPLSLIKRKWVRVCVSRRGRRSSVQALIFVISYEADIVPCARNLNEPPFHKGIKARVEPLLAQSGQPYGRSGLRDIEPR